MDDRDPLATPPLVAANRRLLALRAAHCVAEPPPSLAPARAACAAAPRGDAALQAALRRLPPHLGWFSAPASRSLRAARPSTTSPTAHQPTRPADLRAPRRTDAGRQGDPGDHQRAIRHHPALGLAMLRQGQAAPGRLWLLLRYLDEEGRGWLRIDITKQQLTQPTTKLTATSNRTPGGLTASPSAPHATLRAPHRVLPVPLCSPRQLRNLLRAGEGIFWTRDRERIWLRSTLKVCAALGVERLTGRPVHLPLAALLDGMGTFRAHLYAAFHSGRMPAEPGKATADKPIARATLTRLTGASRRAQRAYEQRAGMAVRANFALGGRADPESTKEAAWRRGRAIFTVKDVRGLQGRKGRVYLAWQLPNSYEGPHGRVSRCRQRHLNRRLADLRKSRDAGNDQLRDAEGAPTSRAALPPPTRRYHPHAAAAHRAHRPPDAAYWRGHTRRAGGRWWYALPAEEAP